MICIEVELDSIWLDIRAIHPASPLFRDRFTLLKRIDLDGLEESVIEVQEKINELVSLEDAKLDYFRKSLAQTIEAGNAAGLDVEFMNPLVEQMRKISENIITKKAGHE